MDSFTFQRNVLNHFESQCFKKKKQHNKIKILQIATDDNVAAHSSTETEINSGISIDDIWVAQITCSEPQNNDMLSIKI